MMSNRLAVVFATLLVGLSAGFFFTYEASVTLGLAEVGDVTYVESFQAINETVRNPAFGLVFFGSIPAIVMAIALNWRSLSSVPRGLLAAALPLYLICFVITVVGNVPLNDELAGYTDLTPSIAATARSDFESSWNRLNLLRALATAASFTALASASMLTPTGADKHNDRRPISETASL